MKKNKKSGGAVFIILILICAAVIAFSAYKLISIKMNYANAQKEYYITEVPELMVKRGMKVETYFTKDGDDLRGINTPEDLEICERILEKRLALV